MSVNLPEIALLNDKELIFNCWTNVVSCWLVLLKEALSKITGHLDLAIHDFKASEYIENNFHMSNMIYVTKHYIVENWAIH